jgi:hypothetical protein
MASDDRRYTAQLAEARERAKTDAYDATRPGQDGPRDEWDERVHAVIEYRDRVADSVAGNVPLFGTAEWASADPATQAASQARFERARDEARGREISDRIAAEREGPPLNREDYPGGRYHRNHEYSALQPVRWPPTGDRATWVRYGPAGPPQRHEAREQGNADTEREERPMTRWKEGTVWDKAHPGALPSGYTCTLIDSRSGLPRGQSRAPQGDRVAEAVEGARAALADAADTRTVCGPAMPRAEWAAAHRTRR